MGNPLPQAVCAVVSRHDDPSLTNAAQSTGAIEMPVLSATDDQPHAVHGNEHSAPDVEGGASVHQDDDDDVGLIATGASRGVGRLRERMSEDLVVRCCVSSAFPTVIICNTLVRCCGIVRQVVVIIMFFVPRITLPR